MAELAMRQKHRFFSFCKPTFDFVSGRPAAHIHAAHHSGGGAIEFFVLHI
jgi:hypothetical protein